MELTLDDAIEPLYNEIKTRYQKILDGGYRSHEVSLLRAEGLSDDDIFIAEMLGLCKGMIESKILSERKV